MFQDAILEDLTSINHQNLHIMKTDLDLMMYDLSNLRATRKLALQLINSAPNSAALPAALPPPPHPAQSYSSTICQL